MAFTFGPYEVVARIADGVTGSVYRTRHVELDRFAAVKELSPQMRQAPGLLERMRREAEILAGLDHPNIVEIYDYVEEANRAWIAEEWVDGASLETIIARHGRLTPEQAVGVVRGALIGLAHAHDHGVVHGDIAPGNILADGAGTSKLVDFGLAAPVGQSGGYGTPAYLSPEAVRGQPITASSDVYSAAAVLYTLLSGCPPFPAPDVPTMLRRHLQDPAPSLEGLGPDLRSLVRRGMDKDPALRPPDARAFIGELEEAAQRRFGPGWLQRASIAGVVAAVTAGGMATAGGAAGGAAAVRAVIDSASVSSASRVVASAASKISRGQTVAIGLATAVVLGGATAGAVALSGDEGSARDTPVATSEPSVSGEEEPSEEERTPTEVPSTPAPEELAPTGVYVWTSEVVSTNYPGDKVGATSRQVLTLVPTCEGDDCSVNVTTAAGGDTDYAWDGRRLAIEPPEPRVSEGLCVETGTNKEIPGTHYTLTETTTLKPLVASGSTGEGPPQRFAGMQITRGVFTNLKDCDDAPDLHQRTRLTMVLRR